MWQLGTFGSSHWLISILCLSKGKWYYPAKQMSGYVKTRLLRTAAKEAGKNTAYILSLSQSGHLSQVSVSSKNNVGPFSSSVSQNLSTQGFYGSQNNPQCTSVKLVSRTCQAMAGRTITQLKWATLLKVASLTDTHTSHTFINHKAWAGSGHWVEESGWKRKN